MVKTLTIESITTKDGKLSLGEIDTGLVETPVRVQVIVDRSSTPEMTDAELSKWAQFVEETEGRINDESFHRQPQGVYEPIPSFDDVE